MCSQWDSWVRAFNSYILVPGYPLIKEWAYAGMFFLLTGALFSHAASDHAWSEFIPALTLLTLAALSWYFRPPDKRLSAGLVSQDHP